MGFLLFFSPLFLSFFPIFMFIFSGKTLVSLICPKAFAIFIAVDYFSKYYEKERGSQGQHTSSLSVNFVCKILKFLSI